MKLEIFLSILCYNFAEHVYYADQDPITIDTTSGKVEGIIVTTINNETVEAYTGIPYAQPPIGDLRFKPPVPKQRSDITLTVKNFGHSCPQINSIGSNKSENESEDCLFLNVWTPHLNPEHAGVIVFLHGTTSLEAGTSSNVNYDGSRLAEEQDVVVVSINFRLGYLGFLFMDHPDAPGNLGLMDQALALNWVQDNIANFGGDPHKVTVLGYLSGSDCGGIHMLLPSSRNLFQRAILLDPSALTRGSYKSRTDALKESIIFAENVGCGNDSKDTHAILSCMRSKSISDLTNTAFRLKKSVGINFDIVVDGFYVTEQPRTLLTQRGHLDSNLQVMIGTTENIGIISNMELIRQIPGSYIDKLQFEALLRIYFPNSHEFLIQTILHHYTDYKNPDCPKSITQQAVDLSSDFLYHCPAVKFADELAKAGNDVYLHYFAARYETSVFNFEEVLTLIFGVQSLNEDEINSRHLFTESIGRFVSTGAPSPTFLRYNLKEKPYYNTSTMNTEVYNFLRADHCGFWHYEFPRVKYIAGKIIA